MKQGSSVFYLHSDHLGSSSVTTDAGGNQLGAQSYFPFGTPRAASGNLQTDFTFTGQKFDASSGLMYYGARYYDAALARFISADTMVPSAKNPQALNRYAYTLNNPLKYIDPTGHMIDNSDRGLGSGGDGNHDPGPGGGDSGGKDPSSDQPTATATPEPAPTPPSTPTPTPTSTPTPSSTSTAAPPAAQTPTSTPPTTVTPTTTNAVPTSTTPTATTTTATPASNGTFNPTTLSIGLTGQIGAGIGLRGNLGVLNIDTSGNVRPGGLTLELMLDTGITLSGGVYGQVTNAKDINSLKGLGGNVGASGGEGLVGGIEYDFGQNNSYQGFELSAGFGLKDTLGVLPAEGHGGISYTW